MPAQEQSEPERRFSQEQYDMLMRCSEKKDMAEWNEWRVRTGFEPVWLDGARLENAYLDGAFLSRTQLRGANMNGASLVRAELQDADLGSALLVGADLKEAKLIGADLHRACAKDSTLSGATFVAANMELADLAGSILDGADMRGARMVQTDLSCARGRGARFFEADLSGAYLTEADFQEADFNSANMTGVGASSARLQRADLRRAELDGAELVGTHLEKATLATASLAGASLVQVHMQGTFFNNAIVDGRTLIGGEHDERTDFTAVGLRSARIDPDLRSRLEGNVRRIMWQRWYGKHRLLASPVRLFMLMSDYGQSTGRMVGSFFLLASLFAVIYGLVPSLVTDLHEVDGEAVPSHVVPFRALYFSVVTMTTLGFGDMYAAPGSIAGHILLTVHVIFGYVLLGALVTRLSILFQES